MAGCGYQGRHFGATYDDGTCIDGYLWDLDSCHEPGGPLHSGGDEPCPSCNADARAEYFRGSIADDIACRICPEGLLDKEKLVDELADFAVQIVRLRFKLEFAREGRSRREGSHE